MRVLGSDAYVHIPDVKRNKMESKAKRLTFVGHSKEHKGKRFVDLAIDSVIIRRHARFIEVSNEMSTVEISVSQPTCTKEYFEDEVGLKPLNEGALPEDEQAEIREHEAEVEDGFIISDEEPDKESDEGATGGVRRSARRKRVPLKHLEDHLLKYAVGIAACAVEEPEHHKEAFNNPKWRKSMKDEMDSHQRNGT